MSDARRKNTPPTHPEERELAYRHARPSPAVPPSSLALFVFRVRLTITRLQRKYLILERSRGEEMCVYSACFVKPLYRSFENFTGLPAQHDNKEENAMVRTAVVPPFVLE